MGEYIDARGLACPAPVMKTRDALQSGVSDIEILVDNPTARDNVSRFASSRGCEVSVTEEGDLFRLNISGQAAPGEATPAARAPRRENETKTVVVFSEEIMGRGNEELGRILMKAFLNTLAESDSLPWRLVFFNRGVMLATEGAETATALKNLDKLGVEILVCGTCVDFFGVKEKVAVGTVSNMYEILTTLIMATNTVSI
jgi:selenium metabolism protein YedF